MEDLCRDTSKGGTKWNTERAAVTVGTTEEMELEQQLESLAQCHTFVGVGGGQAVDVAKYFSVRRGSEVVYVGKTTPDPLIIDFDLLSTAPRDLKIADTHCNL